MATNSDAVASTSMSNPLPRPNVPRPVNPKGFVRRASRSILVPEGLKSGTVVCLRGGGGRGEIEREIEREIEIERD